MSKIAKFGQKNIRNFRVNHSALTFTNIMQEANENKAVVLCRNFYIMMLNIGRSLTFELCVHFF
jgi:hypothetical protein